MSRKNPEVEWPIRAVIDLEAYRHNLRQMRSYAPESQQMAVVKANAYGHGIGPISLAALQAGTEWLGVAKTAEAFALRRYLDKLGVPRDHLANTPTSAMMRSRLYQETRQELPTSRRPRILSWLYGPSTNLANVIGAEIDLSVSNPDQLDQVSHAADEVGLRARVHLQVDTGLSRGGSVLEDFVTLCQLARKRERSGLIEVNGIWSHMARADEPTEEAEAFTKQQLANFEQAIGIAQEATLDPRIRHIAATGAILWYPESHYNLVRVGIGGYGLSPNPALASSAQLGLRPVMQLETEVVQIKKVSTGAKVSYGGEWSAAVDTWLALLPIGYADGILRHCMNQARVWVGGHLGTVVGRVPMDQIIVDMGPALGADGMPIKPPVSRGDLAVIFGDGSRPVPSMRQTKDGLVPELAPDFDPVPTADELARASSTISYEVLTAVDAMTPRVYLGQKS